MSPRRPHAGALAVGLVACVASLLLASPRRGPSPKPEVVESSPELAPAPDISLVPPLEDGIEIDDSMMLQTSQSVASLPVIDRLPVAAASDLADGLAAGVGLINPLLEQTEEDFGHSERFSRPESASEHLAKETRLEREELHGKPHTDPELKERDGTGISKALKNDLLGDSLNPTHHEEGAKGEHHEEHAHGYFALLFLFGGLTLGCLILMLQERVFKSLPYTVMLFVAGFIIAAIHNLKPIHSFMTWYSWYNTVVMWKAFDPHLLFYVFLPALVFSEAMKLNKQLVKTCLWQVLILAGPGVLLGTMMLGAFSHYALPYNWDWPVCLVLGAILSATDPVAVVALFNTLGVSPRLTMVISGESLLNDGTAIVMFTLMMKVALGATLTPIGVLTFFGNMTITSFILGFVVASLAIWIISCCALERGHSDAMIQVVITMTCGYICFFMAESELSTSGILSLVAAGFAMSYSAWPRFVDKEIVHIVWETIEFVGNTMIFLLAGLLFADSCFSRVEHIFLMDLWWLLLMYVAAMVVRAVLIAILWIPLRLAGEPLTWQEGLVMSWSGLRGAVSLAMAIIVDNEPKISEKMGTRVMFHVGGIAALTLLINATTTARLLSWLGLSREPEERERLLQQMEKHVHEETKKLFADLAQPLRTERAHGVAELDGKSDLRFAGADPDIVRSMVPMLRQPASRRSSVISQQSPGDRRSSVMSTGSLGEKSSEILAARCQAYREVFLQVVQNHYWKAIEEGVIPRNNTVARILLGSKDEALATVGQALNDWEYIRCRVAVRPTFSLLANIAQHPLLSFIPAVSQQFPTAEVIETWKIYAVLSYQEAHKHARGSVPKYFTEGEELDRQVQEIIADESRKACQEAGRLLQGVDDRAVTFGRSRMLAQKLLRHQLEEIETLSHHGILNMSEAHHITDDIHDALLGITMAEAQTQSKR